MHVTSWLVDQAERITEAYQADVHAELSWRVWRDIERENVGPNFLNVFPPRQPGEWIRAVLGGIEFRPAPRLSGRWVLWRQKHSNDLLEVQPVFYPR